MSFPLGLVAPSVLRCVGRGMFWACISRVLSLFSAGTGRFMHMSLAHGWWAVVEGGGVCAIPTGLVASTVTQCDEGACFGSAFPVCSASFPLVWASSCVYVCVVH